LSGLPGKGVPKHERLALRIKPSILPTR
jgi:hypothetical protein